jgi:hypothetical protein
MKTPPNLWEFVLAGIIVLALTGPTLAQPGVIPIGGDKGGFPLGGDKGGFKMGGWNKPPEERFKDLAKGKDFIVIDEMPGFFKFSLDKYAKENGITGGKLSLQQYLQYSEAMQKQFFKGFPDKGNPDKGNPDKGNPKVGGPTPPPPTADIAKVEDTSAGGDKMHSARLKAGVQYTIRLKTLQGGYDPYLYLYDPEGKLVAQDDDSDGFPNSKIVYTPAVDGLFKLKCSAFGGRNGGKYQLSVEGGSVMLGAGKTLAGPQSAGVVDLGGLDERPVVYSGAKLPPGLPAWFAQLDTDKDGQIGLYEWLAAKKPLAEFQAMDRNGDGFLTPDEVFYYIYGETEPDAVAAIPDKSGKAGAGKFGGSPGFPKKPGK